jgi:anti-anti-sigma factor
MRAFKLTECVCWAECREILIEGELDRAVSAQFRTALAATVDSGLVCVTVNLERCKFIDGSALEVMVQAQRQLAEHGQELLFYGASGQVLRLLQLTAALDPESVLANPRSAPSGRIREPRESGSNVWELPLGDRPEPAHATSRGA